MSFPVINLILGIVAWIIFMLIIISIIELWNWFTLCKIFGHPKTVKIITKTWENGKGFKIIQCPRCHNILSIKDGD